MNEFNGSDVHPARGLRGDHDFWPSGKLPRSDQLLLVAAGKVRRRSLQIPRTNVISFKTARGGGVQGFGFEEASAAEFGAALQTQEEILADGPVEQKSFHMPVFRNDRHAQAADSCSIPIAHIMIQDSHAA